MGWDVTRMLRFYPKNGDLKSIDIESIIDKIAKTAASLSSEIVYSENHIEKCYDLKFNSSKLSGKIIFNPETVVVWDLISYDQGVTQVGRIVNPKEFSWVGYDIALFAFDEIRIRGNQEKLTTFYKEFMPIFSSLLSDGIMIKKEYESIINTTGFYFANNAHDTGNEKRRRETKKKSCLVSQREYQECFESYGSFENMLPENSRRFLLKEVIFTLEEFQDENIFEGLETISFLFKNRVVKQVEWKEWENKHTNQKRSYWYFTSGDNWDNCVNPKWRDYKEENRLKLLGLKGGSVD